MKNIQVSDETYEFLMNLSKELNTQNNRSTAFPYFFQVQSENEVPTREGCGIKVWHNEDIILRDKEDIKNAIFDLPGWDIDDPRDIFIFNNLADFEIESILESNGYELVNIETVKKLTNAFLTEKACKEHIARKKYHYNNPCDYLTFAYDNPELEQVLIFIRNLTK